MMYSCTARDELLFMIRSTMNSQPRRSRQGRQKGGWAGHWLARSHSRIAYSINGCGQSDGGGYLYSGYFGKASGGRHSLGLSAQVAGTRTRA